MDDLLYYKIKDYRSTTCSLLVKYYSFVRNDETRNIVALSSWLYWINHHKFVYSHCTNIYWFLTHKPGFAGIDYIVIYCKFLIKGWGNICNIASYKVSFHGSKFSQFDWKQRNHRVKYWHEIRNLQYTLLTTVSLLESFSIPIKLTTSLNL